MRVPERLAATYSALGGGWPLIVSWDGTPHPQQRVRVTKRGTYRPDEDDQRALGLILRGHFPEPLTGPLVLVCAFLVPDHRTRDTDNMTKHVLDSGNRIIYADDRQVTASLGYADLDKERPRTIMLVGADEQTKLRR